MNKTRAMLKAQLINFSQINEIRASRGKKQNSIALMGFGIITLVLFVCLYNILTAQILVQVGEQELIPSYTVAVSSFALLFMTIFYSNDILFGSKDMDMLLSLPVKASQIITSKFMFVYLLNFVITFVFMVPCGIVWVMNIEIDIFRFIVYFASLFFVPLIPMSLASFIGVLIIIVSARFKNRNGFSFVLSLIAVGIVVYIGIYSMQTKSNTTNIGATLAEQITAIYPLSYLFSIKLKIPVVMGMLIFLVLSIVTFYLFIKIVSIKYETLHSLSKTTMYKQRRSIIKKKSPFISLYQIELKRFFNSYMTVLNTGLGVILLCALSIFLLFTPLNQLGSYIVVNNVNSFLSNYAPLMIASLFCLSCTSASSISLEGKNVWILESSPVSIRTILNSKLVVNFTIHGFGYLFALIAFVIKLNMNLLQLMELLIIPVCYSIFISVLGIFLNKMSPNYNWDNEVMIIKQSMPVIISGVIGMISVCLPIFLNWFLSVPFGLTLWLTVIVLLIIAFNLYQKMVRSNYI
ncbi:hypothetical protein [Candidatus Enterococcus mansonii]|uniref:Uncharacterized protein n=1 Tax=Candidatus Enterococcus mansonii TaxID=1834181 RepID=A0A242CCN5_9ENTE|nr:hypothetical protein [Enterococcus sp. 4G2_DIV0659]OTO07971.1 hypothetical protein A5880_002241 [Enterococcus sp. 4G2_DIV0659]